MSAIHPRGTRLAQQASQKATLSQPLVKHPKGARLAREAAAKAAGTFTPVTTVIHPKGKRLAAEARAAAAAGTPLPATGTGNVGPLQGLQPGNPSGGYADDGTYYPPGIIPGSDGGSIFAQTGQKVKSGATMAARSAADFQTKIMEVVVVVALVVGMVYVVKRYHLLNPK